MGDVCNQIIDQRARLIANRRSPEQLFIGPDKMALLEIELLERMDMGLTAAQRALRHQIYSVEEREAMAEKFKPEYGGKLFGLTLVEAPDGVLLVAEAMQKLTHL